MVGIVILKDFETGSYSHVRITTYKGFSFADIGKGAFSSCTANIENRSMTLSYKSAEDAPVISVPDALGIAEKAREFVYNEQGATELEYCFTNNEIKFRIHSCKEGVYSPPDTQKLFGGKSFYKLCGKLEGRTFSYAAALRDGLNYAMTVLLNTSEAVFGLSGYGIYINIALFTKDKGALKELNLTGDIYNAVKKVVPDTYVKLKEPGNVIHSRADIYAASERQRIINLYQNYKGDVCSKVYDLLSGAHTSGEMMKRVLSLWKNREIEELTGEFTSELKLFCIRFYDYGYLDAKSHSEILTPREALGLAWEPGRNKEIAKRLSARSANLKFFAGIPCAHYYGSDGRAYWDK